MVEPSKPRSPPPKPPPLKPKPAPSVSAATASAATDKPSGKLGWVLGWVLVPLVLLGVLFLAGVHVGARHPQMWLSRATLHMFDREPQLGPQTDEDRQPMARRLRLAVLPSKDHSFEVDVSEAELEKIAKDSGLTPATIDCQTVCRALWLEKNPEREFIRATHCKVTPPAEVKPPAKQGPSKLECDAKVQR
jgi:hypothetical protein